MFAFKSPNMKNMKQLKCQGTTNSNVQRLQFAIRMHAYFGRHTKGNILENTGIPQSTKMYPGNI